MTNLKMKYNVLFDDSLEQTYKVFSPYRICPIGAHVDHQHGLITGFAIDKGVELTYSITDDGIVEMKSANFSGEVSFSIFDVPGPSNGDWGKYLRGAVAALKQKYEITKGIRGVIEGSLPIGGLSSSAAVILCYIMALCHANNIEVDKQELIHIASYAERKYVGINNGILDQACQVLCKKDHLLYLDTRSEEYELIPKNPAMPDFELAVFYSGLSRSLSNTGYNTRTDECRAASWYLKAMEGMEIGPFSETKLRDIEPDIYEKWKTSLPERFRKRAEHFYGECQRVEKGVEAWKKGDIEAFGRLVFESGRSSIENYETGSEELIALHNIMSDTEGIYGGRFSGAGFKGCCIALIDPAKKEEIKERVTKLYLEQFPHLEGAFSVHFCNTDNGVRYL
ncbi:MAG: GHMP kinase [Clostridiales bacterium]|nr:GHMP kinase [Clostridiales bacterium]